MQLLVTVYIQHPSFVITFCSLCSCLVFSSGGECARTEKLCFTFATICGLRSLSVTTLERLSDRSAIAKDFRSCLTSHIIDLHLLLRPEPACYPTIKDTGPGVKVSLSLFVMLVILFPIRATIMSSHEKIVKPGHYNTEST